MNGPVNAGLGLDCLRLATDYRTGRADPAAEFYKPCLDHAAKYDRAVGYFRSSVYLIVGAAMVEFARRGGRIRLVCSPALYEEDAQSIEKGYEEREKRLGESLIRELDEMLANGPSEYRTRVLASLIASGAMDIRIALRPSDKGIYHEKVGVFRDNLGNAVSFIGSANETWNAWHERGNFESIEVFCSWKAEREFDRTARHQADFEALWESRTPGVSVTKFPEAARERLIRTDHPGLAEIDYSLIEEALTGRTPQPHQANAIAGWIEQNRRGVFEHATGSGKTFTALTAAKEHLARGMPTLILVPSVLLLDQWAKEIRTEIPEAALLLAGAGNDRWRDSRRLASMSGDGDGLGKRIIVATMQTAATPAFRVQLRHGPHLMVIADEVHQIGSPFNSNCLSIGSGPRLGLSATPTRFGDPDGTHRIFEYFGPAVPPPVTLLDAIRAGRLVEYEYHPHPVRLNAEEADAWKDISRSIRFEIGKQEEDGSGRKPLSERAKMMLIQRARIAKKAINKVELARTVVTGDYEEGQRWLVYCEDSGQLRSVMDALISAGLRPVEYHSGMAGDRAATFDWFKSFGGVLVSIKCLDEGVDIPAVSHALILASSQNPRQFIQRRGRVLRRHEGKALAVIHDAIVVPVSLDDEPDQLSLLRSEFVRAMQFSSSALNRSAGAELRDIAAHLGFDSDVGGEQGMEEEEE